MSTLVDLYNGLLKYDNNDIVIVIDDNNSIWFYGRQVAQILKYKKFKKRYSFRFAKFKKLNY